MSQKKQAKDEPLLPDYDDAKRNADEIYAAFGTSALQSFVTHLKALAKKPPQVILFEGGDQKLRMAAAKYWASLLNCEKSGIACIDCVPCVEIANEINPDFHVYNGVNASIKIDEMRSLKPLIAHSPSLLKKRVVVFYEAQAFVVAAANAILKILEEPNSTTLFIFTVPQRERILPTLVSRSHVMILPTLPKELTDEEEEILDDLHAFFTSGKAWFDAHTAQRGYAQENALQVIHLITLCLAKAISERESVEKHALADFFALRVTAEKSFALYSLLENAQNAINEMVNPALVIDTLLVEMFILLNS